MSTVTLKENGVPVEFYVAKHDYESELNGAGRTLLVRKDCYDQRQWHRYNINAYAVSDIDAWLNGDYRNLLDAGIQSAMGTTKFFYTPGGGTEGATITTLERAVFLLSATELGCTSNGGVNVEGTALWGDETLRIAYLGGSAVTQWTRSPVRSETGAVCCVVNSGSINSGGCTNTLCSRPAFTLPATLSVSDDGAVITNAVPSAPGTAFATLGSKPVSTTVKLNMDGIAREFVIVHQGNPDTNLYDASCDGTWLLMKDCLEARRWHSSNVNDYADSDVCSYLNSMVLFKFDTDMQAQIKPVKIPYRPGSGGSGTVNSGANGLLTNIFLLSTREVGYKKINSTNYRYSCDDGAKLDYFQDIDRPSEKLATFNGKVVRWWLRSPFVSDGSNSNANIVWAVEPYANGNTKYCNDDETYLRPALILPSNLLVSDDGSVSANTAPSMNGGITIPDTIQGGSTIPISWSAATDAEGNLEGYIVERSIDGGQSWTQIYQGGATQTTNTVAFGTYSVMYRVRAYDSEGLYSGCRTSSQVLVINNSAPGVPASITVPAEVTGGSAVTVTWGPASDADGDLTGYSLERQVDGGEWTVVYSGNTLSYTDQAVKGWASVAYRVRAFDTHNAYGGYAASPVRPVNNNSAPEIVSGTASGTDLGVLTEGFELSYQVTDADGDQVAVKEYLDEALQRSHEPALEEESVFQAVAPANWQTVLNGPHTLKITANDGRTDSAPYSVSFEKRVTRASVTLAEPMEADAEISVCVLSVSGFLPADAEYTVEATNNAKDESPVWEDCTAAVRSGANHAFGNKTAVNGFAFNFRVTAERGPSGQGGYFTSIQGGFQ